MVDTLRVAIIGSLNHMLSIIHPRLKLGLYIEDAEVLNWMEVVLNLIEY